MDYSHAYTSNDHNFLNMIFSGDELQDSIHHLGFQKVNTHLPGTSIGAGLDSRLSTEFGDQEKYDNYLASLRTENDAKIEKIAQQI